MWLSRLTFAENGSGSLVHVSSIGAFRAPPGGAAYAASKAYVPHFSRALQQEVAHSGIRVRVVLPGPVRTEFFEAAGTVSSMFPDESFIDGDDPVRAALSGLDQGEPVCMPMLPDRAAWEEVAALGDAAGLHGVWLPRPRRNSSTPREPPATLGNHHV
ncbi:SDR family NAD(P)-dependent oxidoreductase [Streptomyces chiangmaiensis]|uniref:SDR family NAD(P)-dependent oxidoreductase n=1 Tax=Streptomyces chiangmaiensis TaxID=766497 RepID=A0ABU7FCJ0_9ACTN|nr:SDR family NAD(P)-dependent oxidoreductase [Streptomyces chiangmaiensis]MED7821629.1 SDR family NAD(P)-dependent oxidoreductase [Streptomyces chiangmaiensis]